MRRRWKSSGRRSNAHCPVLDIVSNPVPVELTLEKAESARAEAAE